MSLAPASRAAGWSRLKAATGSVRQLAGGGRLAWASVSAFLIFVVGACVSFLAQFGAARLLGAEHFGAFAYIVAWSTLLASLTTLGFHVALLRLAPAYSSLGEWGLARGAVRFGHLATALVSVAVAVLGAAALLALLPPEQSKLIPAFLIGLAAVPFLALQLVSSATTRAFGGVALALAPERIVRDGALLLALAAAAWSGFVRMDAITAAAAMLLSAAAAAAVAWRASVRLRPAAVTEARPVYRNAEWMKLAAPLTTLTLADNLMSRAGVLALGLAGRTQEAGFLAIAVSFAQLSALPRMAVATMFAPSISGLHARGETAAIQSLTTRAAWLSLLGAIAVAAPLALLLPMVLPQFGAGFSHGAPAAFILILAQTFAAACGPQQHLLTMTGHERAGAFLLSATAISVFLVALVTVGSFGMIGAAVVMALGQVGWNLAMGRFIRVRLRIRTGALPAIPANAPESPARRSCDA